MKIDFTQIISAETKAKTALEAERVTIKARRDRAISSGITLAGIRVQTDDISQQRIVGAALAATIDPSTVVNWKTAGGFVPLNASTILAVAQAVRAHVQACFDREAELLAALEAGKPYNIDEGWPEKERL